MLARLVCVFAVVTAFGLFSLVSADTGDHNHGPSYTVTIETGILGEAKELAAQRLRAGEWVYNFNPGEEASFFESEDASNRRWQQWKAKLRVLQAYQQKQRLKNYTGGDEKTETSTKREDTEQRNLGVLPIVEHFSDRNVQRRYTERLKEHSLYNLSDAQGASDGRVLLENEIKAMWQHVRSAGSSETPNDQEFLGLVERHFSHTIANRSAMTRSGTSSWFPFALLRTPLVLDAEVLPFMQREVADVRRLWKRYRAEETMPAEAVAEVQSHLQFLSSAVEDSKMVVTAVASLVEPLTEAAMRWVASTLATTREAIVGNDESTEAKRSELRQLLKLQSRLRKVKVVLEKYRKAYQSAVLQGQLPNAEGILFALQLIAKQRFGDDVSGLFDVVPLLSTTAPLTGLLEEEWRDHVLAPYGMCALVTAAFIWICEEIKERLMSRLRGRRLGMAVARNVSLSCRSRQMFMLVSLLETIVPLLLPVLVVVVHLRGARMWMWGMIALMRPSQRAICHAPFVFLMFLNYMVATLLRRVFQILSPSVHRRRLAKEK